MTSHEVCEVVRAAVLTALAADPAAEPITRTYTGVGVVPWDDCCGQLTVTPARRFTSIVFPNEVTGPERCDVPMDVFELLVTLVRCVPTAAQDKPVPTEQQLAAAHQRVLVDAETVHVTLTSGAWLDDEWERTQVRQRFVGTQGGCISSETTILVGVPRLS